MRAYNKYIQYKKIIDLLFLFVLLSITTFFIKYFFSPLFIIVVLLILIKPIYNIMRKIKIHDKIGGALSILIINVFIFCFIFYFGNSIHKNLLYFYNNHFRKFAGIINDIAMLLDIDFNNIFNSTNSIIGTDTLKAGMSITGSSILSYVIANVAVYFLLVDDKLIYNLLIRLLPYNVIEKIEEKKNNFKEVIKIEIRLVLISTVIIIIGFKILRIPSSIFWGILCGMLDVLPYVGTIIVFIPIIIYNIVIKNYLVVIGLISLYILSQIIREILELKYLSSKLDIHPLVVMLSIYIGAEIYGMIGMIAGPVYCILAKDIIYD